MLTLSAWKGKVQPLEAETRKIDISAFDLSNMQANSHHWRRSDWFTALSECTSMGLSRTIQIYSSQESNPKCFIIVWYTAGWIEISCLLLILLNIWTILMSSDVSSSHCDPKRKHLEVIKTVGSSLKMKCWRWILIWTVCSGCFFYDQVIPCVYLTQKSLCQK